MIIVSIVVVLGLIVWAVILMFSDPKLKEVGMLFIYSLDLLQNIVMQ